MNIPIIDLHCDLLSYLSIAKDRTPFDSASRCAHSQMVQGGVRMQTVAIFTPTCRSSISSAVAQMTSLQKLFSSYPDIFRPFDSSFSLSSSLIHLLYAIENASAFADEGESLDRVFTRLNTLMQACGSPLYISLTWNGENRFGGGCGATFGLKPDGEELLRFLSKKKIAIDFSHSSDRLAWDILHFIDAHSLDLPILASHSNFRSITNVPRNIPDSLAKEIIRRKGLIGLNFFAAFLGSPEHILLHVEHALKLGAENTLCFGADFFCDTDITDTSIRYPDFDPFFPEYSNASVYPKILRKLSHELKLPSSIQSAISHGNVLRFIVAEPDGII